jgi:Flp pilus assembly protein TadG
VVVVSVHRLRRAIRGENGAAAVEFALVTPLLLIFLLGIFEFGRAWNAYHVVTNAASEGARLSATAQNISIDSVKNAIRNNLALASLDPDQAAITVEGLTGATGTPTKVSVEYRYNLLFWKDEPDGTDGSTPRTSLRLRTASVMRRE